MRERFAKKREPVWCDWAEGRARGREEVDGSGDDVRLDTARKMETEWGRKELLTSCLIDRKRKKACLSLVIWPGVGKYVSPLCSLCPWVYTAGCSWCSALSQSRTANAACFVSQSQTFNIHTYVQTHTHTELSSTHWNRAYMCYYKRTLLKSLFVTEKC